MQEHISSFITTAETTPLLKHYKENNLYGEIIIQIKDGEIITVDSTVKHKVPNVVHYDFGNISKTEILDCGNVPI